MCTCKGKEYANSSAMGGGVHVGCAAWAAWTQPETENTKPACGIANKLQHRGVNERQTVGHQTCTAPSICKGKGIATFFASCAAYPVPCPGAVLHWI